jgi:hypothetical protein
MTPRDQETYGDSKYTKDREKEREEEGRLESNQMRYPAPAGAPNGFHIYCKKQI